jgi:hypothetical protein
MWDHVPTGHSQGGAMALPLRVTVSPDHLDANPGDVLTLEVTVRNTSDVVEHYVIDTLGLPEGAGARSEPEVTKLRPGETGNAAVHLTVKQQPPPEAGVYTLGILVRSRYRDEISRCEELPLTVAPVEKVSLRIEPEVATGGRSANYTVQVTNEGNTRVRLRLSSTDPERRVVSSFRPAEMDLWPGAAAQSLLAVRAPIPWSKEKQRVLRVDATGHRRDSDPASPGAAGGGTATFVQRPRFASKLTRVAGVLGSTAVLAAAVVAAAVILKPDNKPTTTPTPGTKVDAQTAAAKGPSAAAASSGGASATPAQATGPTGATQGPSVAAVPQDVDLTRPNGKPGDGVVASDAFRTQGITLSGLPDPDGPSTCATATATAIRGDTGARFLAAALPDNPAACNFVPVQIRFVNPASSVEVVLGGQGKRRMEVVYRDLSRSISDNLKATDDGRHGGIDYVLIRGLPADLTNEPPPAAVRKVRFTPATQ